MGSLSMLDASYRPFRNRIACWAAALIKLACGPGWAPSLFFLEEFNFPMVGNIFPDKFWSMP